MRFVVPPALRGPLVCLGLFLGTLLLFSRALGFGFTSYDDPRDLTSNSNLQAGLSAAGARMVVAAPADYRHPLPWVSHRVDWLLYGGRARGHHLTSILWHALNAALVFLLARRLTGAFWISALCAALFAWHPLRVESVVWIAQRQDVLGGFFFLLTLWSYLVYAEKCRAGPAAARRAYALTLAAFAGGLLCQPALAALPGVLLLLDFWPLQRGAAPAPATGAPATGLPWTELLREKIPFFALALVAAVASLFLRTDNGAFFPILPFGARLATALVSVPRYLGTFLWPFGLTVCYAQPDDWSAAAVGAAAALVLLLTAATIWQRRPRPWLLAGWGWFLVMLAPSLGLVRAGSPALADRSTYLPIIGLQLAVLWTLRDFALLVRCPVRIAAAGLVLAGCVARTWVQEGTWRDPVTLFEHALAVTARNDRAHFLLGAALFADGRLNEAELHARRAMALNPNHAADYDLLGDIQVKQGRIAEAGESYRRVLQLDPGSAKAEYALGVLLLVQRQPDEAIAHLQSALRRAPESLPLLLGLAHVETLRGRFADACGHFRQAIALQPRNTAAHFGLALALEQLGRVDEALASYTTVTELTPDDAAAHVKAGLILLGRNQPAEARRQFETALKNQPRFGPAYVALGLVADRAGHAEEAIANYQRALACNPNDASAHSAWADILARNRRFDEAISHYREALRLSPDDASFHARLGSALYMAGRRADAVKQWEEALRLDPNLSGLRQQLEQVRGK